MQAICNVCDALCCDEKDLDTEFAEHVREVNKVVEDSNADSYAGLRSTQVTSLMIVLWRASGKKCTKEA